MWRAVLSGEPTPNEMGRGQKEEEDFSAWTVLSLRTITVKGK